MNENRLIFSHLRNQDSARVRHLLAAHLTTSMFLWSNMARAGLDHDLGLPYQGTWVGVARADSPEQLLGVAALFWNGNLLVQCPELDLLPELAARAEALAPRPITGLIGPWEQLERLMEARQIDPARCDFAAREPLYERATASPALPSCSATRCRLATPEDEQELARWLLDFDMRISTSGSLDQAMARIQAQRDAQHLWVLCDAHSGERLAMTMVNATVEESIFQIGGVWTPPTHRNKGYARRVVAGQIEAMHLRGYERVILFTDAHNIAAQRAYEAIGFRHIGEYGLVLGIRP